MQYSLDLGPSKNDWYIITPKKVLVECFRCKWRGKRVVHFRQHGDSGKKPFPNLHDLSIKLKGTIHSDPCPKCNSACGFIYIYKY